LGGIHQTLAVLKDVSNGIPPQMLSDELLELVAHRLQAMAEPTRIRLLTHLEREDATVQELTDELPTTHQNVSRHLAVLYKAGLVTRQKEGKCVRYALSDYTACRLVEQARACVSAHVEDLAQITGLAR
jgi:DNA-binding transcriptional ArsR family regulator